MCVYVRVMHGRSSCEILKTNRRDIIHNLLLLILLRRLLGLIDTKFKLWKLPRTIDGGGIAVEYLSTAINFSVGDLGPKLANSIIFQI